MTIKFLREVLKHYEDREYDDWNVVLFDYNNQRNLIVLDGTYAASKDSKTLSFPVLAPPVDGITIDKRVDAMLKRMQKFSKEVKDDCTKMKKTISDFKTETEKTSKKTLDTLNKIK